MRHSSTPEESVSTAVCQVFPSLAMAGVRNYDQSTGDSHMLGKDEAALLFAREFLKNYTAVGFGSLTKRETDLLFFRLLQEVDEEFAKKSDFDAALALGTTMRRVRTMRDELSFRAYQDDSQLRKTLRNQLTQAEIIFEDQQVKIQLDNAVTRGFAEKLIREEYGLVDRSFNEKILSFSGEQYMLLALKVLDPNEQKEVEKFIEQEAIRATSAQAVAKLQDKRSLLRIFAEGVAGGAGEEAGKLLVSGGLALATGGKSLLLQTGELSDKAVKGAKAIVTFLTKTFAPSP